MKSFSYNLSEEFKTCETDECESIDKKEMLGTTVLKPGQKPNFSDGWFLQKTEILNYCRDDSVLQDEDVGRHWLPDPCFVHLESMDIQTPKVTFLPNKPNVIRNR